MAGCLILFVFYSCKKDKKDVHFHGMIYADCDNSYPVKNVKLYFWRMYDNGIHHDIGLGYAYTNDEGYYTFDVELIDKKDEFMYYQLIVGNEADILKWNFGGIYKSFNNSENIEINGEATPTFAFGFHIKNAVPFDNNDELNLLKAFYADGSTAANILVDLTESSIDTTVYRFLPKYTWSTTYYNFTFTKNGVETNSPTDSLIFPICLDTSIVEVFY
jgi:hypothetical protein